jgi:hypothetical protein
MNQINVVTQLTLLFALGVPALAAAEECESMINREMAVLGAGTFAQPQGDKTPIRMSRAVVEEERAALKVMRIAEGNLENARKVAGELRPDQEPLRSTMIRIEQELHTATQNHKVLWDRVSRALPGALHYHASRLDFDRMVVLGDRSNPKFHTFIKNDRIVGYVAHGVGATGGTYDVRVDLDPSCRLREVSTYARDGASNWYNEERCSSLASLGGSHLDFCNFYARLWAPLPSGRLIETTVPARTGANWAL